MLRKRDAKDYEIKDLKDVIKQGEARIVSLEKEIAELKRTISDMKSRIDVSSLPTYHERIPGR